jgi:hypothetical protein
MKTSASLRRKSPAAWLLTGLLVAGAALGLSQTARADTSWSVSVAQPGVILTVGGGHAVYPSYPVVQTYPAYPVVYEHPVVVHPHPVTVVRPPHHPPHGHAWGHGKHRRHDHHPHFRNGHGRGHGNGHGGDHGRGPRHEHQPHMGH